MNKPTGKLAFAYNTIRNMEEKLAESRQREAALREALGKLVTAIGEEHKIRTLCIVCKQTWHDDYCPFARARALLGQAFQGLNNGD